MRALAFMTLTAGILATAPVSAFAAQIVENFTIDVTGDVDQNFLSTPFDLFDPSLGTLLGVAENVTGSPTWDPGDSSEQLLLVLAKTGVSQFIFASGSGAQAINVNLSGAGGVNDPLFVGVGTTQESLVVSQSPGAGTLSGSLSGQVTYSYSPAPVPEPSTWAMMLIGFAGLGYAAARRKGVLRAIPC
jgi:hypothetical protein